ncbi:MAG TPA: SDR family NAD(P)-dependent oxidoreductase [Thermoanaerobaculia bacterium]|jgi:NAD(P)-dependent dehydrogenase (short-subunit alcohol dehydrogenase family)|nr:SDR family NAD(P)-dependent oxidoreductase [Thermoanaerobaculia bacterium]
MNGRVLITGAAGALGRSVVRRFVAAGERVLAVGDRGLAEIAAMAPPDVVRIHQADLTVTSEVDRLFAVAEEDGLAAVVHTVGGFRWGKTADFSDDDWSFLLKVNLDSTFRVFRATARAFTKARAGSLVAVASPAGLLGEPGMGAYAATKAGVLRLVESLARELAPVGARVNSVLPGTMDTAANRAAMPDADFSKWVTTDAVASVIHFLTTPAASAVNGAAVRVPGPIL